MSHQKSPFPDLDLTTGKNSEVEFPDVFVQDEKQNKQNSTRGNALLPDVTTTDRNAAESKVQNASITNNSNAVLEESCRGNEGSAKGGRTATTTPSPAVTFDETALGSLEISSNITEGFNSATSSQLDLVESDVEETNTDADVRLPPPGSSGVQSSPAARRPPRSVLSATVMPGSSSRTDYTVCPSKMALLIIDIQEYLSSRSTTSERLATDDDYQNHYLYNVAMPSCVSNIRSLVTAVRERRDRGESPYGSEVVFTFLEALTDDCRDVSLDYKLSGPKLATLPGPSSPAKFLDEVSPSREGKGDILVPKTSCSVFNSTNLDYILRNLHVEQLVVCGQLSDQCVESAVRDAADLGYFVTVVEDACAATSETNHAKGLAGMKGFSRIVTTKQVLVELEEASNNDAVALSPPQRSTGGLPHPSSISPAGNTVSLAEDAADGPLSSSSSPAVPLPLKPVSLWRVSSKEELAGATEALLSALKFGGRVKFLRYMTLDVVNSVRCKAVPIDRAIANKTDLGGLVSIAKVCFAGLPSFADAMVAESRLDARGVLTLHPDLSSLKVLPYANKTAVVLTTAHDQLTGQLSPLCTRGLLARVIETAKDEFGLAFNVGAELEFSLFRDNGTDESVIEPVDDSLFGNATTLNAQEAFICDAFDQLKRQGIDVELVHAESACGQLEIVLPYQEDAMKLADNLVFAQETIRVCARQHKMRALFLPKTFATQAGNGMHLHFSFRDIRSGDSSRNAFPDEVVPGALSSTAASFVEGLLVHLPALLSVTIPSVNSFRRFGPGCWTGHSVCWSVEDKEVSLRVCRDLVSRKMTNVEYKLSDASANIFLELAVLLSAGLDGVQRRLQLRPMSDAADSSRAPSLPQTFSDSIECLRNDEFLLSVMGEELATGYIALRQAEIKNSSGMTLQDELRKAYRKA